MKPEFLSPCLQNLWLIQYTLSHRFLSNFCWYYPPICSWFFQVASYLNGCPTNPFWISHLPHACHMHRPFNLASFDSVRTTIWWLQIMKIIRWYNQARLNWLDKYTKEREKYTSGRKGWKIRHRQKIIRTGVKGICRRGFEMHSFCSGSEQWELS